MKNIVQSAKNIKQEIIDVRRAIHKTPEVGKSLPKTRELVISLMKRALRGKGNAEGRCS